MKNKIFIFLIIMGWGYFSFSQENKTTFLPPFSDGLVGYYSNTDSSKNTYPELRSITGTPFVPSTFFLISSFSEGVAIAVRSDSECLISYLLYSNGDSMRLGNIFPLDLDNFTFSENLLPVCVSNIGKCGFINKYGKFVIPPIYGSARSFSNGLAPVQESIKNGKWGYINTRNELVIPYQYKEARSFSTDRVASVMRSKWNEWSFIDINGNPLNTDTYYRVGDFSDGLCPVLKNVHDSGCYIDLQGHEHIKGKFKFSNSFSEGLAAVSIDGEKYGYINRNGEMVIPPQYCYVMPFKDGHAIVCTQTPEVGDQIINARGEVVLDIKTFQTAVEDYKRRKEDKENQK